MSLPDYESRIAVNPLEVTSGGASSTGLEISGLAVPYGQLADIRDQGGEYQEVFMPGSFAGQKRAPQMYFHHAQDQRVGRTPIGRWDQFWEAADGFRLRGHLFDNQLTRPLIDAIQGGVLRGLSLNFRTPPNGDTWTKNANGRLRTVTRATTREVSITDSPAYETAGIFRTMTAQQQANYQRLIEAGILGLDAPTVHADAAGMTADQRKRDNWMRLARII